MKNHNVRFILDTSFLMESEMEKCLQNELLPIVRSTNKRLAIPKQVIHELDKHQHNIQQRKKHLAKNALKVIKKHLQDWFELFGEYNDADYTDHLLNTLAVRYAPSKNLIFVTQDKELTRDLYKLQQARSFRFHMPLVVRLEPHHGHIESWNATQYGKIRLSKKREHYICPHCHYEYELNATFLKYLEKHHISACPKCNS